MNEMIGKAYDILFISALIIIGICMLLVIIKSIKGPRITDRVVNVNMTGTLVIISICILTFLLEETFLLDVSFIYVLISFLAVVVLTTVYINSYLEKKKKQEEVNETKEKEEK